jgi:hypothetical protein
MKSYIKKIGKNKIFLRKYFADGYSKKKERLLIEISL